MANKRQRKKQAKERKVKRLERAGVDPSRLNLNLSKTSESDIDRIIEKQKKVRQKERRKEKERRVYHSLIAEGVDPKEARKMRGWGQKRIDSFLKDRRKAYQKKQAKKKRVPKPRPKEDLLVYWQDKGEWADDNIVRVLKHNARLKSQPELILENKGLMGMKFGEIGRYAIMVTDRPQDMEFMFGGDHEQVYQGKAIRYDKLLQMVNVMLHLLYDPLEKYQFVSELAQNVNFFSRKNAARLNHDFL